MGSDKGSRLVAGKCEAAKTNAFAVVTSPSLTTRAARWQEMRADTGQACVRAEGFEGNAAKFEQGRWWKVSKKVSPGQHALGVCSGRATAGKTK